MFCYEKPPLERTFTISGTLGWKAVMRVSDEYHEETGEMVGDVSLVNVKSADKYLTFMSDLFFPMFRWCDREHVTWMQFLAQIRSSDFVYSEVMLHP